MPSVVYEIYEGPQTVHVIPAGPSHDEEVRRYTKLLSDDQARRSRTFMARESGEYESRSAKYAYEAPYSPQLDKKIETAWRSRSPERGRRMERYVEIRSRQESEPRAPSPHPKGILRLIGSDEGEEKREKREKGREKEKGKKEEKEESKKESKKEGRKEGKKEEKEESKKEGKKEGKKEEKKEGKDKKKTEHSSSTSTTMSMVGGATALTTTIRESTRTKSSSRSPSPSSRSSSSSKKSQTRTDFSSYARTSSRTGTFYFAYNPNLSPAQMRKSLKHNPRSSKPIALAKIPNFTWYINSRGAANIASCEPAERKPAETDADIVWGLLYNLDPDDESDLDTQEGWSAEITGGLNKNIKESKDRPWIQGGCSTNKLFLEVEAVEWFVDPRTFGVRDALYEGDKVRSLVYIDEVRVKPGRIRNEYITKMREGVTEAIEYGVPKGWVENVMLMYGIAARKKKVEQKKRIVDIEVEEETEVEEEVTEHEEETEAEESESESRRKKTNEKVTIIKEKRRSDFY